MNENNQHPEPALLYEYLDGELPAGQSGALEAHLAQCPACSARFARFQKLYSRIAEVPEQIPARDFARPVLEAISKSPPSRRKTWRILDLSTAVQALAALALLWIAIPNVYQAFVPRGLAWLSTQAGGWLALRLSELAAAGEQGRLAAQHGLQQILDLQMRPVLIGDLPVFEIIAILAVATLIWLAGNGYLLGLWNSPSMRRKS